MAWPLVSWVGNLFLPRRLHPVLLYVIVGIVGYLLLMTSVFALDSYLKSELYKFDLDGNGSFNETEMTQAAQQAMDDFTHDTGRTFAPIFGAPLTAIWVLINFAVLYCGEWIFRALTKLKKPTEPVEVENSNIQNDDLNPYRPPNAR